MSTGKETTRRVPKATLYSLAAANFAVGTGALVIAGIVPEVAADLSVSTPAAGLLIAVYALVYAISAPLISVWASGWDKKRLLVIAMIGLALSSVLALAAPSFGFLIVARILGALSAATITPVAAAIVTMIVPRERTGMAMGLVFGGIAISTVLGVPLGAFIAGVYDWRAAFALVAVLSVLALLALLRFVPDSLIGPRQEFAASLTVLRDGPAMGAVSITALVMTAQFIPFSYAAVLFSDALKATAGEISWLLFAFGLASVFGNQIGGCLSDRLSPNRVLWIVLGLLPFSLFLLSYLPLGFWFAVAVMAFWGAVGFGFNAPQQARLAQMRPEQTPTLLALNASAIYVGTTFGSVIGGGVLSAFEPNMLGIAGGIVAMMALAGFFLSRGHRIQFRQQGSAISSASSRFQKAPQ